MAPESRRWHGLGDLVAVTGAGSVLAFLLTNWWLPFLSPLPALSARGMAATLVGQGLLGLLLGLRARRTSRAVAHVLAALALGVAGFAAIVYAPALAGVPEVADVVATFAVSRSVLSAFMAGPAGLLGAVAGAAVSEHERAG